MDNADHDSAVIEAFFDAPQKHRLLGLLTNPNHRTKFREYLAHPRNLSSSRTTKLPGGEQTASKIHEIMSIRGAPITCVLLSENPEWDGKHLALIEALDLVVTGGYATIVSCIPGELAYYEAEGKNERYVLQK